ncbi:MAG: hypothetical protein U0793_13580 [Gemmataceae bacterium]
MAIAWPAATLLVPPRPTPSSAAEGRILDIFDGSDPEAAVRFNTAIHENAEYLMLRYRPELKTEMRGWHAATGSSSSNRGANRDPPLARTQIEVLATCSTTPSTMTPSPSPRPTRVHFFDKAP